MQRIPRWLICFLLFSGIGSSVRAALLAYEPANYPATNRIDGFHGGYGWRTVWGGFNGISEPGLTFGSLLTSGRAVSTVGNDEQSFRGLFVDGLDSLTINHHFGRDGTTLWLSFLFRRDRSTGAGEWAGLSLFNDDAEELFVGVPVGQQVLGLHVWDFGQAPSGLTLSPIRVENGVVYLMVVRLSFGAANRRDLVELFVNPEPGVEPGNPVARRGGADIRFRWVRLASGYGSTRSTMDEIRIGTEYKDVVPGIALPASSPWFDNIEYDRFGRFSAMLRVETGYAYRVQSTTDFKEWSTISDFLSFSPEFRFHAPPAGQSKFRFFRIVSP